MVRTGVAETAGYGPRHGSAVLARVVAPRAWRGRDRAGGKPDRCVVVLAPSWAPNQHHRAEVAKLLVHRRARRGGLADRLMAALTEHARVAGFRLLTLNTP